MRKLTAHAFPVILLLISFLTINIAANKRMNPSISLFGQDEQALWETYTSQGEEFSVLMPELPGVILKTTCLDNLQCKKKRLDVTFVAYGDGVVYLVTSYQNPNHRQTLKEIIAYGLQSFQTGTFDVTAHGAVTLNNFSGERFAIKSKKGFYDRTITFYLTKDHVYEISAAAEDLNQPAIQKFFDSFALGSTKGKEIGYGARTGHDSVAASDSAKTNAPNSNDNQPVTTFKPQEVTRKAAIILRSTPEYTEEARQNQVAGTVVLQMVFAANGKVTNIRTISPLASGLTEKAIAAARKIYFLPAIKDGKRVSQWIRVEYNFNIY